MAPPLAYHKAVPHKNVTQSSGTSPLAYHKAIYLDPP